MSNSLVLNANLFLANRMLRNLSDAHSTVTGDQVKQDIISVAPGATEALDPVTVDRTKAQLFFLSSNVPVLTKLTVGATEIDCGYTRLIILPYIPDSVSFSLQAESDKAAAVFVARSYS